MTKSFVITLLTFLLVGCDYENPVDYNVLNQSDRKLKIVFNQWDFNNGMYITGDTTVYVNSKEKMTLLTRPIIGSSVWNPEYGNDTIWEIHKLLIFKNDSILVNKNFRMMIKWEYVNLDRHHSELNLKINNEDLE